MGNTTPMTSAQKTTKCIIMSRVSTTIQDLDIQEEECRGYWDWVSPLAYSVGVTPNCFWKHFVKYDGLLNPTL